MLNGKLTQKDITQHCTTHVCNSHSCKYMTDYCHIREHATDACQECDKNCKGCKNYV